MLLRTCSLGAVVVIDDGDGCDGGVLVLLRLACLEGVRM